MKDSGSSRMDQYEVMGQIGRGAFGSAILVYHKLEKKKYVLKKIRLARQTDRCRRSAHQEMALISKVVHPYIVEYKESWVEKGCYVCIVLACCDGGDMANLIKKSNGVYFSEERLCKWLTQILLAVDHLHSNHILHRDLKCSNIFLTKEHDIRLGDFGLAKMLNADGLTSSVVGTPNYMCPELLADIPYGYKSDIWSLGCCMYEMTAHKPAFKAFDMQGLVSKISNSSLGPLPSMYSAPLKGIIKSMLRKNPESRPSASELLKHPHLQAYAKQFQTQSYFRLRDPLRQIHLNDNISGDDNIYNNHMHETTRFYDSRDPLMDSNQHIDINRIEPCDWPLFYDGNDTSGTMSESHSSLATATGILNSMEWMEEICTPGDNLKGKGEGLGKVTPKIPPNFSKCRGRDGETPRVVLNGTPRIRSPQIKPSPATSVQKGRQSLPGEALFRAKASRDDQDERIHVAKQRGVERGSTRRASLPLPAKGGTSPTINTSKPKCGTPKIRRTPLRDNLRGVSNATPKAGRLGALSVKCTTKKDEHTLKQVVSIVQKKGAENISPHVSVNAPRLDSIPPFSLTTEDTPPVRMSSSKPKKQGSDIPNSSAPYNDVIHVIRHRTLRFGSEEVKDEDLPCIKSATEMGLDHRCELSKLSTSNGLCYSDDPPHSKLCENDRSKEMFDRSSFRARAEALEGLLELSAELLQQQRVDELAVVLKPFGRGKVSPRETAIWLTKSLKDLKLIKN